MQARPVGPFGNGAGAAGRLPSSGLFTAGKGEESGTPGRTATKGGTPPVGQTQGWARSDSGIGGQGRATAGWMPVLSLGGAAEARGGAGKGAAPEAGWPTGRPFMGSTDDPFGVDRAKLGSGQPRQLVNTPSGELPWALGRGATHSGGASSSPGAFAQRGTPSGGLGEGGISGNGSRVSPQWPLRQEGSSFPADVDGASSDEEDENPFA